MKNDAGSGWPPCRSRSRSSPRRAAATTTTTPAADARPATDERRPRPRRLDSGTADDGDRRAPTAPRPTDDREAPTDGGERRPAEGTQDFDGAEVHDHRVRA